MAQLPKGGLVRGHDKPIHESCAIYFPGGGKNSLFKKIQFGIPWLGSLDSLDSEKPDIFVFGQNVFGAHKKPVGAWNVA